MTLILKNIFSKGENQILCWYALNLFLKWLLFSMNYSYKQLYRIFLYITIYFHWRLCVGWWVYYFGICLMFSLHRFFFSLVVRFWVFQINWKIIILASRETLTFIFWTINVKDENYILKIVSDLIHLLVKLQIIPWLFPFRTGGLTQKKKLNIFEELNIMFP